jgi:hypothetical protein
MQNLAHEIALQTSTPLMQAFDVPLSFAQAFFASNALENSRKADAAKWRINVAVVERLNAVIKGLGMLARRR